MSRKTLLVGLVLLPMFASAQGYDNYNDAYFTEDGKPPNLFEFNNGAGAKTSIGLPPITPPPEEEEKEAPPPPEVESPGAQETYVEPTTVPSEPGEVPRPVIEEEKDLVTILLESGGILGISTLPGSEAGPIDFAQFDSGGFIVVVDGQKVRDAFGNDIDASKILSFWKNPAERKKRGGKLSTGEYYALLAATIAEEDGRLDRAAFKAGEFEITYRSRGALFAFIPFSFPVRVTVRSHEKNAERRVEVRLPWYRLFVREFFTPESLEGEIDVLVQDEMKRHQANTVETQALLFAAVAEFLKQKVRTISDTIVLRPL